MLLQRNYLHLLTLLAIRFWAPQLSSYSEKDHYLKQKFLAAGWYQNTEDDDLSQKLYLKLTRSLQWRWLNAHPIIEDHLIQRYTPENFHTEKVTAFIAYKDKLFFSLANGSIQRRMHEVTLLPSPQAQSLNVAYTLHSGQMANQPLEGHVVDESHVLGRYKFNCSYKMTDGGKIQFSKLDSKHVCC